jgi:poly-beta-1,6-N-acetyl-D-glucosamine N-deacetylase
MENESDPSLFYKNLIEMVKSKPDGLKKTIFELQATDWRNNSLIPSQEMADTIRSLYDLGAIHVGYYPDNIHQKHPDPAILRPVFNSKPNTPILYAP